MKHDLERIESEAQRAAKIVQNLLSFARNQENETEPLDLNEVIAATLEMKSYDHRVNNIEVETALTTDLPKIRADKSQMQSVILNLIGNAQDAMTAAHGKGMLTIRTKRDGDNVLVAISDDGSGIKPEYLGRLFDPFFTTKEVGKGTGLGLSICHGIVTGQGGRIWVESEYGKGATFYLAFEVAPESPEEDEAKLEPEAPVSVRGRILVINDEAVIRDLAAGALSQAGHRVEGASSGREALEQLDRATYDLLLLDMKMPEMDGKEFFQALSHRASNLASRVIFVTGDTVSASTRKFLETSGRPSLQKPFDLEELERLVAQELEKASQV